MEHLHRSLSCPCSISASSPTPPKRTNGGCRSIRATSTARPTRSAAHVFLEEGYGETFGFTDDDLRPLVGGLLSRAELIARCDVILLTKPQPADLLELREGQTLWGWPHCVQDRALTQAAIDRKLTLIAWEAMNHWSGDGNFLLHVFHKNNELAGYGSVLHAMSLTASPAPTAAGCAPPSSASARPPAAP